MSKPGRILITGGLGYMGSWLTRTLALAGHSVFILSRGARELPDLGVPYTFIPADIVSCDPAEIAACLPPDLDACVHAAAAADHFVEGYARSGLLVNGLGTRNMLQALYLYGGTQAGKEVPLFFYLSTFHVYGRDQGTIDEQTALSPANDYGLTHLFGEEYCRMFARKAGLPSIILRPSNGYGAPSRAPFDKWYLLVNDLCRMAVRQGQVSLKADPARRIDLVWLGDVGRVVDALLYRRDLAGKCFNVSSGRSLRLGQVARLAARTAGRLLEKPVRYDPPANNENTAPGPMLFVDNTAVRHVAQLAFSDLLEDQIAETIQFLLTHPEE